MEEQAEGEALEEREKLRMPLREVAPPVPQAGTFPDLDDLLCIVSCGPRAPRAAPPHLLNPTNFPFGFCSVQGQSSRRKLAYRHYTPGADQG